MTNYPHPKSAQLLLESTQQNTDNALALFNRMKKKNDKDKEPNASELHDDDSVAGIAATAGHMAEKVKKITHDSAEDENTAECTITHDSGLSEDSTIVSVENEIEDTGQEDPDPIIYIGGEVEDDQPPSRSSSEHQNPRSKSLPRPKGSIRDERRGERERSKKLDRAPSHRRLARSCGRNERPQKVERTKSHQRLDHSCGRNDRPKKGERAIQRPKRHSDEPKRSERSHSLSRQRTMRRTKSMGSSQSSRKMPVRIKPSPCLQGNGVDHPDHRGNQISQALLGLEQRAVLDDHLCPPPVLKRSLSSNFANPSTQEEPQRGQIVREGLTYGPKTPPSMKRVSSIDHTAPRSQESNRSRRLISPDTEGDADDCIYPPPPDLKRVCSTGSTTPKSQEQKRILQLISQEHVEHVDDCICPSPVEIARAHSTDYVDPRMRHKTSSKSPGRREPSRRGVGRIASWDGTCSTTTRRRIAVRRKPTQRSEKTDVASAVAMVQACSQEKTIDSPKPNAAASSSSTTPTSSSFALSSVIRRTGITEEMLEGLRAAGFDIINVKQQQPCASTVSLANPHNTFESPSTLSSRSPSSSTPLSSSSRLSRSEEHFKPELNKKCQYVMD